MVGNILPEEPPPLGVLSIGLNTTFSEQGHVACQIKWNHECTNMVGNILPEDPPPLGVLSIC